MNWLWQLLFRWRDKPRPHLAIRFHPGSAGSSREVVFRVLLTNDGTLIARGVVVRALLDGEVVVRAEPVDVPVEASPVEVSLPLTHPDQADLSPALNNRPVFHGKKFTAEAEAGGRVVVAEWPHEEEQPPPPTGPEERHRRALQRWEQKQKEAGDDLIDV